MAAHLLRLIAIVSLIAAAVLAAGCDTTRDRSSSTSGGSSGPSRSSSY